jgi:hypothetical protein
MKYVLVQETGNPDNTWFYVMDDTLSNVVKIVDHDCNEVPELPCHEVIDANPTLPICAIE